MQQDDNQDEMKDKDEPETGGEASPDTVAEAPAAEGKPPARKKPGETKEHKEHKDHQKVKALRAEIEEWKAALENRNKDFDRAKAETAEWREKTLRTLAETDNQRKRLEREKNDYFQFALSDVLKEVLVVIDNLERAIKAHDAPDGFRGGVELIWKQMTDLVAKRGVMPIPDTGGKFDPSFHHALSTEEAEGIEEPMIGEMLQKGYMLNDRLLRPALVKVLVPKKG